MQGSFSRNSDRQAFNQNPHHLYTQQIKPSQYTKQLQNKSGGSLARKQTDSALTQTQSVAPNNNLNVTPKAQEDQKSLFDFFIKRTNSMNSTASQAI